MFSSKLKTTRWLLLVAAAAILLLSQSSLFASQHEKTTYSEVKQETAEAYNAIKDYTVEQREDALAVAEDKLAKLDHQIDSLEQDLNRQWDQMSEATRQKKQEALRTLRKKHNDVAEWIGGLKHSSADAWEEVKRGFGDSLDRLQQAFNKASKEFDDKP